MSETFDVSSQDPRPVKKKKLSSQKILSKFLFLGVVAALAVFAYLYFDAKNELSMVSTAQGQTALAQKEVQEVTDQLGKLTILPEESPVVATILDAKLLATQSAFYTNAENGDKLVVYPNAQKAYIYSPTKNVIVNSGPLVVDQDPDSVLVKFELRNGAASSTELNRIKAKLESQQQLITATSEADDEYEITQIIILNEAIKTEDLTAFAQEIDPKARISRTLPQSEESSEADILIIVGGPASSVAPDVTSSP